MFADGEGGGGGGWLKPALTMGPEPGIYFISASLTILYTMED